MSVPELSSARARIASIPPSLHCPELFDAINTAVRCLYVRHPGEAIVWSPLAVSVSSSLRDPFRIRRGLNLHGACLADAGRPAEAFDYLVDSLELGTRIGDAVGQASCLNNLALAFMDLAHYDDAIACAQRVVEQPQSTSAFRLIAPHAFSSLSQCWFHLHEHDRSRSAALQSARLMPDPRTSLEIEARLITSYNLLRAALILRDVSLAAEHVELTRRAFSGKAASMPRARILFSAAEGLYDVHCGRVDVGLSRICAAHEAASNHRSLQPRTLEALITASEAIGRDDLVTRYRRDLIAVTQAASRDSILRYHRHHLDHLSSPRPTSGADPRPPSGPTPFDALERCAVSAEHHADRSGAHIYRVGELASLLAHRYGCEPAVCDAIRVAARLHDIGMLAVPVRVRTRLTPLGPDELEAIQWHVRAGSEWLAQSDVPHADLAQEIALFHHERWDGSGYPFRLSGNAIPLHARIVAIADVFDALTHSRPYRPALSVDDALAKLVASSGSHFEPALVERFVHIVRELLARGVDLDRHLGAAATHSPFFVNRARVHAVIASAPI